MVAACPFPAPRGTPIRIHRMAEALGRRGHEVHIVTYHFGGAVAAAPSLHVHRIAGPASYTDTSPGPSFVKFAVLDPRLTRKLCAVLGSQAFDVLHAHHYEGLLCALLARRRRAPPLVFDAHTLLESELPSYGPRMGRVLTGIGRVLDRRLPRRADHVIAVSDELRAHFERLGVPAGRVSVISNGVEAEHFHGEATRAPRDVVAFAGNLAPYQRIDLLLRAFTRVVQAEPAARLRLLTDGDFTPLRALARELGILSRVEVMAVGYAELPRQLRAAAVLVNPRTECSGVPQKLLNYMASATPVVSFAGSAKMLVHEVCGLVVEDADIPALATAIIRVIRDPELGARLGRRARALVTEQYSWDQTAARVERVYTRLIRGESCAAAAVTQELE